MTDPLEAEESPVVDMQDHKVNISDPLEAEARRVAGHTPGPWRIVPYGDGDSLVIHDARGDWRVCFMATPGDSGDLDCIYANARLIAAAPDLLAAGAFADDLEMWTESAADTDMVIVSVGSIRKLRTAIAKARGLAVKRVLEAGDA